MKNLGNAKKFKAVWAICVEYGDTAEEVLQKMKYNETFWHHGGMDSEITVYELKEMPGDKIWVKQ